MESDLQQHQLLFHDHNQKQKQLNSGLTRHQSAPISYLSSFLESCEDFLNRPNSPETERFFARFLDNPGGNNSTIESLSNRNLCAVKPDPSVTEVVNQQQQHQAQHQQQQQSNYSTVPQRAYQNKLKPPLPDQKPGSGMNYRRIGSVGMRRVPSMKTGGGNSNLTRRSSSPAGLLSNISIEKMTKTRMAGYAVMRGMEDYGTVNRENSYSAANIPLSGSRPMSPIVEMGDRNMVDNISDDNVGFGEARTSSYGANFPVGTWDDSAMMSAAATKGLTGDDRTLSGDINVSETPQAGETGIQPPLLAHHLSLPKTSTELSAIEKFLQLQDSVPCKIRAKRGYATHPRSIAERVRRTRISERMRKLQDLVPNMDKQTNTADMLDLAVEYIKDLQKQIQTLQETSKCICRKT